MKTNKVLEDYVKVELRVKKQQLKLQKMISESVNRNNLQTSLERKRIEKVSGWQRQSQRNLWDSKLIR